LKEFTNIGKEISLEAAILEGKRNSSIFMVNFFPWIKKVY